MGEIREEEANYPEKLPMIYNFGSDDEKEELLSKNFERVILEVEEICKKIQLQ